MLAQGGAPKAKRRCATLGKQRQNLFSALPKASVLRSGAFQNKGTLLSAVPGRQNALDNDDLTVIQ
jgi:hypothetical protein